MSPVSRHQCLIYEGSPLGQLEGLAAILVEKLKANNRCLYLNSPPLVAEMRTCLSAVGLDVEAEIEKGSLVLSSSLTHLKNGQFEQDKMMHLLRQTMEQALADGYAGVWASGDMAWEFGGKVDMDKLLNYEHALEDFLQENRCFSGICQYHRDTIPPYAIQIALIAHQTVRVNSTLVPKNPHYQEVRDVTPDDIDRSLKDLVTSGAPV